MIWTIGRRHYFGSGTMKTKWVVSSYGRRTPIGCLVDLIEEHSFNTAKDAKQFCKANGIDEKSAREEFRR